MRIIFVGIHNKIGLPPLCSSTKSGKLIDKVIVHFPDATIIKSNLFNTVYLPDREIRLSLAMDWHYRIKPRKTNTIILLGNVVKEYFYLAKNFPRLFYEYYPSFVWGHTAQETYIDEIVDSINFVNCT